MPSQAYARQGTLLAYRLADSPPKKAVAAIWADVKVEQFGAGCGVCSVLDMGE
jgi:hypothetical protein